MGPKAFEDTERTDVEQAMFWAKKIYSNLHQSLQNRSVPSFFDPKSDLLHQWKKIDLYKATADFWKEGWTPSYSGDKESNSDKSEFEKNLVRYKEKAVDDIALFVRIIHYMLNHCQSLV